MQQRGAAAADLFDAARDRARDVRRIADLFAVGAECLGHFCEATLGARCDSNSLADLASPSGYTRSVDCFTAFQPVLSKTIDKIGSLYCWETAKTELGLPK